MSRRDWLLLIHVGGAFCVLAGALFAVVLNQAALRRGRPSEIALLLGLIRIAVVLIVFGMGVTLVFGLWLLHDTRYDLGDGRRTSTSRSSRCRSWRVRSWPEL